MSEVRIELAEQITHFEPGQPIRGEVHWSDDGPPDRLVVSLLWHTEGKGTEDVQIVAQTEVDASAPSGRAPFRFDLPREPWSVSGTLLSIVWTVEASMEPKGGLCTVNIVVAPGGNEVRI